MIPNVLQTNETRKSSPDEKKIFISNGKSVTYTIKRTYLNQITQEKMIENIIRQHIS